MHLSTHRRDISKWKSATTRVRCVYGFAMTAGESDSEVLNGAGPAGHWGLAGMRERAELIGGKLEVWSSSQSGTEIELSIPASIAYAAFGNRTRWWFFG